MELVTAVSEKYLFPFSGQFLKNPESADSILYMYIAFISIQKYKRHPNAEDQNLYGRGFTASGDLSTTTVC